MSNHSQFCNLSQTTPNSTKNHSNLSKTLPIHIFTTNKQDLDYFLNSSNQLFILQLPSMLKKPSSERNNVINIIKERGTVFQITALTSYSLNQLSIFVNDCQRMMSYPPSQLKSKQLKELKKTAKQKITDATNIAITIRTQSKQLLRQAYERSLMQIQDQRSAQIDQQQLPQPKQSILQNPQSPSSTSPATIKNIKSAFKKRSDYRRKYCMSLQQGSSKFGTYSAGNYTSMTWTDSQTPLCSNSKANVRPPPRPPDQFSSSIFNRMMSKRCPTNARLPNMAPDSPTL